MNNRTRVAPLAVVACLLAAVPATGQEVRSELRARRADVPPVLDGVLDDEVWSA